jgi:prepilin-type processing-associated H-X9-DG protein
LKRLAIAFVVCSIGGAASLLYVDGHVPAAIPDGADKLDYGPFSKALEHVSATGLVDYAGLRKDRAGLDAFVAQLARISPINRPDLFEEPEQKLAFWLNAYHALVLQAAIDVDPDASLDGMGRKFYWLRTWPIGGRRFTLWSVERRFLRDTGDSRVPFALACGALGCALLDGTPYQADTLDPQLNDAVSRFVQNEHNVKLMADGVHLSPLFLANADDIRAALPEGRTNLLQFVWAFLPLACETRPGCDTRGDLDRACGPKLEACKVKYEAFDWRLAARP